jgi:hypothetical protein
MDQMFCNRNRSNSRLNNILEQNHQKPQNIQNDQFLLIKSILQNRKTMNEE